MRRACVNPAHLRWASRTENMADKVVHGTDNRGEKHPRAKLTEADVAELRRLVAEGMSHRQAALHFGVSKTVVGNIAARRLWRHVGAA